MGTHIYCNAIVGTVCDEDRADGHFQLKKGKGNLNALGNCSSRE